MLLSAERERLLRLARRSLEARVHRQAEPDVERGGVMDHLFGAFVTIHRGGELRGCLGRIEGDMPLGEVVRHLAQAVSDSDPRFQPVQPHELAEIEIEISVLTPEREVAAVSDIEVGRHGLIVERGRRRGLLLPQVAAEHGWTRETFLEHACLKAGLTRTAWHEGARLFVFEAEIFAEPPGP
jgi:AmmeMemoRadiSam system protein A